MIRQKYYEGDYSPGITSTELRALADLLDHEQLPTDPYTILSLEQLGFVVDLETGDFCSEAAPGVIVGNVRELTPLLSAANDMPPAWTLIDILKMPETNLTVNGTTIYWHDKSQRYIAEQWDEPQESFATCAAALLSVIGALQLPLTIQEAHSDA